MRRMSRPGRADGRTILTLVLLAGLASLSSCAPEAGEGSAADADTGAQASERAGPEIARQPNTLTARERDEGWRLLFDGETFAGWRGLGRDRIPEGHWVVDDGTIHKVASGAVPTAADGQPLEGGDIVTETTFRDFELVLEWKVAPGANSGVKYNVSEELSMQHEPVHAALGFEFQILDDDLHPDALNGPNRTAGALYDLIPPNAERSLRPVGEFNEARIVFQGSHGEHWLNGSRVVTFDLGTPRFDSLLAVSKYQPIEGFADRRSGPIVLQDHGDDVWFRSIRIRELPPSQEGP